MDLEEAKDVVQLSKEERIAIERYLGYRHTNINILAEFSAETYLSLKDTAWSIDVKQEEIAENIQDFVNLYAAMCKQSKGKNVNQRLVRGTSTKRVEGIDSITTQFWSTSTDENIAKTFTEYGDGALLNIQVGEGVPFLDPTPYRSENQFNEREIILPPFCQAYVEYTDTYNGYTHYRVTIRKPVLDRQEPEKLAALQEEVLSGFGQNIQDIKSLDQMQFRIESMNRAYVQARGDREEQEYIIEEAKKAEAERDRLKEKTSSFKEKLQTLLKGLCRQKEIEINQAFEFVEEDKVRRKEEAQREKEEELARKEAEQKETAREAAVGEINSKLGQNPENASSLEAAILKTYDDFVRDEQMARKIAQKFKMPYHKSIESGMARQLIEQIQMSLQEISSRVAEVKVDGQTTLEKAQSIEAQLTSRLDGVSYGLEISKDFKDIIDLNEQQLEQDLKKGIYERIQAALQEARIQKYTRQKAKVQAEKVGLFGKLSGKQQLKEQRLENLDLKMQLAQKEAESIPEQASYSIREMLADIRMCVDTELGGKFTKELQEIYEAIKSTFKDKDAGEFSEQYVQKLVNQRLAKQSKAGLPAVQKGKTRNFGKARAEARMLETENQGLKQRMLKMRTYSLKTCRIPREQAPDAIALFEQRLKGIATNIQAKDRTVARGKEDTLELW